MTSRLQKLFLAAALAAVLPAAALAAPCDDGHRVVPVPARYDRAPAPATWRHGDRHERREVRELRAEYRALESERDVFLARWGWHARKTAKFERSYAARRAELDRRWHTLHLYARR
jgi:hypothetical protein